MRRGYLETTPIGQGYAGGVRQHVPHGPRATDVMAGRHNAEAAMNLAQDELAVREVAGPLVGSLAVSQDVLSLDLNAAKLAQAERAAEQAPGME